MARTEARRKADASYRKRQREKGELTQVALRFGKDQQDLYRHVKAQPNGSEYLRNLIRKDMEGGE